MPLRRILIALLIAALVATTAVAGFAVGSYRTGSPDRSALLKRLGVQMRAGDAEAGAPAAARRRYRPAPSAVRCLRPGTAASRRWETPRIPASRCRSRAAAACGCGRGSADGGDEAGIADRRPAAGGGGRAGGGAGAASAAAAPEGAGGAAEAAGRGDRAGAGAGRRVPGPPRRPHRPPQPRAAARSVRRSRSCGSRRHAGAAADRPRRLQGAQRHARPLTPATRCCGRSGRGCAQLAARRRHAGAPGRRRVRGRAARRGDEDDARARPGCGCAPALERAVRGRRHRRCTSTPASASRCSPSTRPTREACCSAPTSRCTRPSAARTGHEVYLALRATATAARGWRSPASCAARIDAGQLVLHYQPRRTSRPATIARRRGAGALGAPPARRCWAPTTSCRSPSSSGLIAPLTAFVLDRALDGDRRPGRHGFDLSVAVNLGPATCSTSACPPRSSGCSTARLRRPSSSSSRSPRTS